MKAIPRRIRKTHPDDGPPRKIDGQTVTIPDDDSGKRFARWCQRCDRKFMTRNALLNHIATYHKDPGKCR